ncbi:MAG TPA: hypothetical protein PLU53_04725 [Bacteroidia bacterium]|nr:hypothetical protein [Bacteroidia bacterium]
MRYKLFLVHDEDHALHLKTCKIALPVGRLLLLKLLASLYGMKKAGS